MGVTETHVGTGHNKYLDRVGAPWQWHAGYPSYGCTAVFFHWHTHCNCHITFRLPFSFGTSQWTWVKQRVTISTRGQQFRTKITSPCEKYYNSDIKGAECDANMHRGEAFQIQTLDWGHQEGKVKVHLNDNRVAPEGALAHLITLAPGEFELPEGKQSGLTAEYYSFSQGGSMPDLANRHIYLTRVDKKVYFPSSSSPWSGLDGSFYDHFAVRWTGVYKCNTGYVSFEIESDDGSKWYWNGNNLDINNDGLHGMRKRNSIWRLLGGSFEIPVKLLMFEKTGGAGMILRYREQSAHGWTWHTLPESKLMSEP